MSVRPPHAADEAQTSASAEATATDRDLVAREGQRRKSTGFIVTRYESSIPGASAVRAGFQRFLSSAAPMRSTAYAATLTSVPMTLFNAAASAAGIAST